MAKTTTETAGKTGKRPLSGKGSGKADRAAKTAPPRAGAMSVPSGIISELRKVDWPSREELFRMTWVVIVTVLVLALIFGIVDYVFGVGVKQLYIWLGNHITGS